MKKSRRRTIEKNLRKALLDDGPMAMALFEWELQDHIVEYLQSKRADHDDFLLVVTEHTNDVAMLLIDEHDAIHINENARAALKKVWRKVYRTNMELLIPNMAKELDEGKIWWAGVKVATEAQIQKLKSRG